MKAQQKYDASILLILLTCFFKHDLLYFVTSDFEQPNRHQRLVDLVIAVISVTTH